MNEDSKYYVVEYRIPISIPKASSPKEAANKAALEIEKEFGFYPSAWFARVFEYNSETTGIVAEWFCSPGGAKFRRIDKNIRRLDFENEIN